MKPRFEEHEGKLFRMLEEPEPLTPYAEMPCLVRLIRDDSPMGRMNKRGYPIDEISPIIVIDLETSGGISTIGNLNTHLAHEPFEIIGYPVEEGSKEWALYQMMQGKKVVSIIGTVYWKDKIDNHFVKYADGYGHTWVQGIRYWLEFIHDEIGWQLYKEPESQYKVGDWVEFRDIEGIKHGMIEGRREEYSVLCNGISQSVGYKFITRKLSPSEIVVKIGCLSGTVRPVSTNGIHMWFHLIDVDDKTIATIRISCLDTPTRELVESLLEAMRGDK